ncbi:hypothetical protein GGD56_004869 [Rhizobium mongolense]|uniref:Uncharacterized protein n=2 Tax=Rhizobium mongolense TaxID=57676 RepID=A0ABR6ITU8_9HYPH|nr:hypothetical protein [Rhizobium mongolense]TVZ66158.1 hypothetical protein BCL32_6510 [Rhizobium mongolense USDA 1844]
MVILAYSEAGNIIRTRSPIGRITNRAAYQSITSRKQVTTAPGALVATVLRLKELQRDRIMEELHGYLSIEQFANAIAIAFIWVNKTYARSLQGLN